MLVDTTHVCDVISIQEGFRQWREAPRSNYSDHYLKENAATDQFESDFRAESINLSVQYNLLRGFGQTVGSRTINVNKINLGTSDLNFKNQVINTVVTVLNQYYALVADYEDLHAKQSALDTAQQFYQNTQRQEQLGALSSLDVITGESQVASSQNDLVASQASLLRDKRVDSEKIRSAAPARGSRALSAARIITLDRITVPASDDLAPLNSLVEQALSQSPRPRGIEGQRHFRRNLGAWNQERSPALAGCLRRSRQRGVGRRRARACKGEHPLVGGIPARALAQVFRSRLPHRDASAHLSRMPINNRQERRPIMESSSCSLRQTPAHPNAEIDESGGRGHFQ